MATVTPVTMDDRRLAEARRRRRRHAIDRLAERREGEAVRHARARAMADHPSARGLSPARRRELGLDPSARPAVVLQVVSSSR